MTTRYPSIPIFRLSVILAMACLIAIAFSGSAGPASAQAPISTAAQAQSGGLVLRIYYKSHDEYLSLVNEFGLEQQYSAGGYLSLSADHETFTELAGRGLNVEIDAAATMSADQNPVVFGHNPDTFFNGYYTVEEMEAFLDQKVAQYPGLAQKVDFGDSWCKVHIGQCTQPTTSSGYDMLALRITNQSITGTKPVFWFNAGIHAREIVPPELAINYINWLLDGYNTNADARWLVDWDEIWIVPMSNPDGHHIAENGTSTPRTQRKNADKANGCTTYPPTGSSQFGTDLNRNFTFMWNCCGGSSGSPCSLTYRGPTAASDPETQAITNQRALLIPDQRGPNITDAAPITTSGAYLDMHSDAALTLYPWGQTMDLAPNNNDLRNMAKHMAATDVGGNGYEMEQSSYLYFTDGASDDAEYGDLGAPAFTIELNSGGTFTPPYSVVATDWAANKGPLIYLSKTARQPYLLTRGPDTNTVAATPMTTTQGSPVSLTASINYNWFSDNPHEVNTYLQNVAAAEYYIDTPPWAGGTAIPMQATDGSFDSATEAVQATVDTTHLAPGRHIVLVRGRGVNDYEGFHSWGVISAVFIDILPGGGTATPTFAPTNTSVATSTPVATSTSAATSTPANTSTRTSTPVSSATSTPVSTSTSVSGSPTQTTPPTDTTTGTPQATSTGEATATSGTATETAIASATATACTLQFTDVPPDSTFYSYIHCLACLGIINGYTTDCDTGSPCFRPASNVTRGQIAKIVSNAAGFSDDPGAQIFEDVPVGSTFYDFVGRLATREVMSGYPCGGAGEPCGSGNLPYFRPNGSATRGQLAKIVSNAANYQEAVTGQTFEDVLPGSTFYDFVERLALHGVMSGYPCGGVGEPCMPGNRPYFRPSSSVTRGQTSKIVSNTFFPDCAP